MPKNQGLIIINFKSKSSKSTDSKPKIKRKRGPKKWLKQDIYFFVKKSQIKDYPISRVVTLKSTKKQSSKTIKVTYCDKEGQGLAKSIRA